MGNPFSKQNNFVTFADKYFTLEDVQSALQKEGIESCNLIIGIDYTKSNIETGTKSFNGKSLHYIQENAYNPYQEVIYWLGKTLEKFDEDKLIPVYGFGDIRTKTETVFNIKSDMTPCYTLDEALDVYSKTTPYIQLSGPTSFCPLIKQAIGIVRSTGSYHILIIITDGCVTDTENTAKAIIEASNYPISIITVGVGDGPFDMMEEFDDELPKRKFDNFQFVNFNKLKKKSESKNKPFEILFTVAALQEIPDQYNYLKKNNCLIINKTPYNSQYEFKQMNQMPPFNPNYQVCTSSYKI